MSLSSTHVSQWDDEDRVTKTDLGHCATLSAADPQSELFLFDTEGQACLVPERQNRLIAYMERTGPPLSPMTFMYMQETFWKPGSCIIVLYKIELDLMMRE